jgi:pimeloyl-ACP methyl ester carboxylesterase
MSSPGVRLHRAGAPLARAVRTFVPCRREVSRNRPDGATRPVWLARAAAAALLAGLATPTLAQQIRPQEQYHPPGEMLRAGPETLHLDCAGSGQPTVILEAGLGGNYLDWTFVQPLLAARVRTCRYDRAGMGFSAPAVRPRTLDNLSDDLAALLEAAHVDGPLVVAGHSYGGMLAMHFARLHPDRVVGLVLVDSMHPEQFTRFAEADAAVSTDPNLVLGHTHPAAAAYGLPDALKARAVWLATETKSRKAVIGEMRVIEASLGQAASDGFPQVPARVIVHGDGEWDQVTADGRMERAWRAMQDDLARRLGAPAPIVAAGASHQVPLDAPDLVADVIAQLFVAKPR